jgi:hypothetical protein
VSNARVKQRQFEAALKAQFQLKQRLERIEWEETVYKTKKEALVLDSVELPQIEIHED